MAKQTHSTILSAIALAAMLSHAHAADTLADMDIEVSPELQAQGIDPGVKHMAINGRWQAVPAVVALLAMLNQAQQIGPVVWLGDSIIAQLGSPPGVLNLAVGRTDTPQILASVAKIPANASLVVLEGGANNYFFGDQARIVSDYQQMIAAVERQAPRARIEVIGILPVNEVELQAGPAKRPVTNAQIAAVDAQIAAGCSGKCSVLRVPPLSLSSDGLHPSPQGSATLSTVIAKR